MISRRVGALIGKGVRARARASINTIAYARTLRARSCWLCDATRFIVYWHSAAVSKNVGRPLRRAYLALFPSLRNARLSIFVLSVEPTGEHIRQPTLTVSTAIAFVSADPQSTHTHNRKRHQLYRSLRPVRRPLSMPCGGGGGDGAAARHRRAAGVDRLF